MADGDGEDAGAGVSFEVWGRPGVPARAARRGNRVLRDGKPWSETVFSILRHLEDQGFDGAPRVIGSGWSPDGQECLTFVPGKTLDEPFAWSPDGAFELGRLIRRVHRSLKSSMKYVILIHSNPEPWGHPTSIYTAEGRRVPPERHEEMDRQFDTLLREISDSGEFVSAEALGDPASATLYAWSPQGHLATDGPYAESKEHLAGFFLIDCATRERAEQIAAQFAQPGGVVELRPVMWPGGDDQ